MPVIIKYQFTGLFGINLVIMIRSVDGNLAKEKDLDVTEGVYVDSLTANSAAVASGVKGGDVILEVYGNQTKSSGELLEIIGRHRPGDQVKLRIDRKGKRMDFSVTLRNQEGDTKLYEKEAMNILDILGIELEAIDNRTARKLDIPGGLKITDLKTGKLSQNTNVREGLIITKVDAKPVKTMEKFVGLLENKKGGVMLEGVYEDYPGVYYYASGL